jgi:acyl-CoA synthetase (NDP forming)
VTSNPSTHPHTSAMNEHQAKQLLHAYGIPVVPEIVALDRDQVLAAARDLGYPVVVKGLGARLTHKTERGLVCLHLNDARAVEGAVSHIRKMGGDDLEGFLVQPQVQGQRELMAGLFRDPQFGAVVLFGVGGVLTEAVHDIVLRLAPLTRQDAVDMIDSIHARVLLDAFRGEAAVNREALIETLLGISRLAEEHPEIAEIDINPLRVDATGMSRAVDALVVTRDTTETPTFPEPVPAEAIGALFYPRSIAFIGASSQIGKWGHILPISVISGGYQGEIHLVNPKGGTIAGRPVFKQVADIPGPVDLAVVTVPAKGVPNLFAPLQAKGIRYMVLITSGFGETGATGKELEAHLTASARKAGILLLGPNTMGITNPHINLFCTGAIVTPRAGSTTMVAQSGNMGTQLLAFAEQQGIGIRGFAGSGNEAMITIEDYVAGLKDDALTRTVVLYIESIKNGRRFFEAARETVRKKPIVLLKGGQTDAGLRAAASHTGAMMTDSRVFNAMCDQAGITKVDHPMELLDLAAAFASLPLPKGPRVAVMTWGGGWGVVTADLCQNQGLEIPTLNAEAIAALDGILPSYWSRANPVDLVGEQDLTIPVTTLETLMQWEGCDAVIHLGIMGRIQVAQRVKTAVLAGDPTIPMEFLDLAEETITAFEKDFKARCITLMERHHKPVIGVSLLSDAESQTVYRISDAAYKAVVYETPERAVNALSKMVAYRRYLSDHAD